MNRQATAQTEAIRAALDRIDRRFGPIVDMSGSKQGEGKPPWWIYTCRISRPAGVYFTTYETLCSGSSFHQEEAERRALGEAIERYCLYNSHLLLDLETAPASQCVVLHRLPVCAAQEQCASGYKQIEADENLTLTRVEELASGTAVWLPAGYVHLAFSPPQGETPVTIPTSTGGAFHKNQIEAILSGVCEVAERDALMLCWLGSIVAPQLQINKRDCPFELHERLVALAACRMQVKFWDISTDFPMPAVLCAISAGSHQGWVFSSACAADPVKVLSKALDEAVMLHRRRFFDADRASICGASPAPTFLLEENIPILELSDFLSRQWCEPPTNMEEMVAFARRLKQENNLSILWVDVTAEDVADLGVCVKVVVPEMVPLSVLKDVQWLGTKRLIQRAQER